MNLLQAIILGIIQGLTEFLPISSSAHLVIAPYLLGWQIDPSLTFTFDVLIQNGTLVAVIAFFRKDLWEILKGFVRGLVTRQPFAEFHARLGWYLILATIPAGIFGLLFKSQLEVLFNSPVATAAMLFITAALLLLAERFGKQKRGLSTLTWLDALAMGFAQALSVFPGISRSGATITGGMLRQLDRPSAARFSFLMSLPVMLAAGAFETIDALSQPQAPGAFTMIAVGFIAAAVVGYLSIAWLLNFLQKRSLSSFAIYCVVLAIITILVSLLR